MDVCFLCLRVRFLLLPPLPLINLTPVLILVLLESDGGEVAGGVGFIFCVGFAAIESSDNNPGTADSLTKGNNNPLSAASLIATG
jgi:hypothetical protein